MLSAIMIDYISAVAMALGWTINCGGIGEAIRLEWKSGAAWSFYVIANTVIACVCVSRAVWLWGLPDRAVRSMQSGVCPACAYEIAPAASAVDVRCPECGFALEAFHQSIA